MKTTVKHISGVGASWPVITELDSKWVSEDEEIGTVMLPKSEYTTERTLTS